MFGIESAQNPTLLFALFRALLRLRLRTPALPPLFQLPREITQSMSSPHRIQGLAPLNFCVEPAADHAAQLIHHF